MSLSKVKQNTQAPRIRDSGGGYPVRHWMRQAQATRAVENSAAWAGLRGMVNGVLYVTGRV